MTEGSDEMDGMPARLRPGSRIAGYVIEERIGAGGMAVVFRARDTALGGTTALKVLTRYWQVTRRSGPGSSASPGR